MLISSRIKYMKHITFMSKFLNFFSFLLKCVKLPDQSQETLRNLHFYISAWNFEPLFASYCFHFQESTMSANT